METVLLVEKVFFVIFFTTLIVILVALIIQLNHSAKITKLVVPTISRMGLIGAAVFLAGSIIIVLLAKP
ncbi:hypothetical protein A3G67_01060 [Candidatus Roizmanbacteria bacterium RIFCSPLOWO2_12_FULL_40_12]|uniref:Uncharacterized protein n=1 Tax=Candidatus Roizmanbacteria bacterium RIFCSPLOWO2_01_FULL_40_42 TaxID=1802066 RepID=A0A1F7J1Z7_9BACT|nr:MAG: hypothetical protein A2779_03625 [Candidatus Roizmanbacteria bacterium RIFCSPHIGHO2_01_FULL_40_98]OGK27671.1 MAG: hypothetical protein A3C31_04095 [Candidatus Roizmanbacteria bacterium RIFCSPHIGHO2_02_FULL_40_53]OGK29749.1 MAG: hypothetical protein A2W49_04805 [Candidatus Roizmanbacteria bacterium RIFCSPHIGHO2_12_41_18]OGK37348.1 MAG: hypothetical protein A3E69_04675 [Candidatus Roizmanbacteria bacterium RIFCSPHIGHO2_12_FULL_40_130]OGK49638.1 MAG: hypothetical protein A3B50_04270 [Candi